MPSRAFLSEEAEKEERVDRDRLDQIDARIRVLRIRRSDLIDQVRQLSGEQKALYDARQAPQNDVERMHEEHVHLGQQLLHVREDQRRARDHLDDLVVHAREVRYSIRPGERLRPEQVRKEIAELERRQQTHALPLQEENALIERLRERTKLLAELEANEKVISEHNQLRTDSETAVRTGKEQLDRLGAELAQLRKDRDAKMDEIRARLVDAGAAVARMREKGLARRDVMAKLDELGRELAGLDREALGILGRSRDRREEARATIRAYAPRRGPGGAPDPRSPAHADRRLEELLKRGKVELR